MNSCPVPELLERLLAEQLAESERAAVVAHVEGCASCPALLAGTHASAEELARFRREAEVVARLQHPHVVQVFEVGEHDGLPFLALEYVEGGSLAQRLQGTPLPARHAAEWARTVAGAVHAA